MARRCTVPSPPRGFEKLKWYGPGLLWMLSSVGSGSVLFTPRVGSRYGYELLWLALVVIFFQWVMIREVGRYTVVTGRTLLDGYRDIPGPKNWAIWFIFVPQLVAASVTISGIAALLGSALMIAFPGSQAIYASAAIIVSIVLVTTGKYHGVERVSSVMAILLVLSAVVTAVVVFPSSAEIARGLRPSIPAAFDSYFVLPWLGFILAGAAGIMWFSYWVSTKGYGGAVVNDDERGTPQQPIDSDTAIERLASWNRVMSNTALVGIVAGGVVVISFLVLGAEVLRPEGIVPEGIAVAEDLSRLLSGVWGQAGRWILLIGIFIALWGTIIADQDGWGRTFADATLLLKTGDSSSGRFAAITHNRDRLKNVYAVVVTALIPLGLFFLVRDPVKILSVAGIVAAAHTPVVVFLTLYLNKRSLPSPLRAGSTITLSSVLAGLFFLFFALFHFYQLLAR